MYSGAICQSCQFCSSDLWCCYGGLEVLHVDQIHFDVQVLHWKLCAATLSSWKCSQDTMCESIQPTHASILCCTKASMSRKTWCQFVSLSLHRVHGHWSQRLVRVVHTVWRAWPRPCKPTIQWWADGGQMRNLPRTSPLCHLL